MLGVIDLTNLIKDNDKGEGVSFDTLKGLDYDNQNKCFILLNKDKTKNLYRI